MRVSSSSSAPPPPHLLSLLQPSPHRPPWCARPPVRLLISPLTLSPPPSSRSRSSTQRRTSPWCASLPASLPSSSRARTRAHPPPTARRAQERRDVQRAPDRVRQLHEPHPQGGLPDQRGESALLTLPRRVLLSRVQAQRERADPARLARSPRRRATGSGSCPRRTSGATTCVAVLLPVLLLS